MPVTQWSSAVTATTTGNSPYYVVPITSGGVTINLEFVLADHPTLNFETDVENAATLLAAAISNKITVNLKIGYGEVNGNTPLTSGSASGGPDAGQFVSYSTVRADLIANAAPGDTNFNALPTGSSIGGQSQIEVWNAQLKLFGLLAPNDTSTDDGYAGFAMDIPDSEMVGVALHELTHAMGRAPQGPGTTPDIFEFFRFTNSTTRLFQGGFTAPAAYFSLDGNPNTKLADYGQTSDASDFLNTGVQGSNDPFNELYSINTIQKLTQVDLTQLDVLGFNTTKPLPSLQTLFSQSQQDSYQAQGLTAGYVYLGFGVPTVAGYNALISNNDATDFGAGAGGLVFNQESIFISAFVNLITGNSTAATNFTNILGGATTLMAALTDVYDSMVPTASQTAGGLNFFLSEASYYTARAAGDGLTSLVGQAAVGAASLADILVNSNVSGLGQEINLFLAAVANGSAVVPATGGFTPMILTTMTNTGGTINFGTGFGEVIISNTNYAGVNGAVAETATLNGATSGQVFVNVSAFQTATSTITDFTSNVLVTSAPSLAAAEGNVAFAIGNNNVGYFAFGGNEYIVATGGAASSTGVSVNNYSVTGHDLVIAVTGGAFHHITDSTGLLTLLT